MAVAPEDLTAMQDSPDAMQPPSVLNGPAPSMPDFARYIPQDVMEREQNQAQAEAWASEQRGKLADTWAQIQHSKAADMVTQAIQSARSFVASPDQNPPSTDNTDITGAGTGNLTGLGQDVLRSATEPGAAGTPSLNPLDIGSAIGNVVTRSQGREPVEPPSIPVLTGAANAAGALSSFPGPGAANVQGIAQQVLDMKGIPAMAGASVDLPASQALRQALTADHPVVQAVADAVGADAQKVADFIASKGFDKVLKAPGRYVDQPGRLVESAAYGAYKIAGDAALTDALVQGAQKTTGKTGPLTDDEVWKAWTTDWSKAAAGDPATIEALRSQYGVGGRDVAGAAAEWDAVGAGRTARQTLPPSPAKGTLTVGGKTLVYEGKALSPADMLAGKLPAAPDAAVMRAQAGASVGGQNPWDMIQRSAVRMKMLDPLYHLPNIGTELETQFVDPWLWGKVPDIMQQTRAIVNDPAQVASLLQEAPKLNLAGWNGVNDLTHVANGALSKVPVLGGVIDKMDQFMFGTVTKRAQVMSYLGAKASGMDADAAAMYANAKYGQIPKSEQNAATQWVTQHLAFAGRWLQGTGIQLGSLVGRPDLLTGFGATMPAAQKTQLANALRGDFLKGVASMATVHTGMNFALSGHGPWDNEDGHWLDWEVTGLAKQLGYQGTERLYLSDPFFRRMQDAAKLLAVPGSPMSKGMGTTTGQTLVNKAGPLTQAVPEVATGSQYLQPTSANVAGVQPGFLIIAKGTTSFENKAKQVAAWAWNTVAPINVTTRTAKTGSPLAGGEPQLSVGIGPLSQQSKQAEALGPVATTLSALTSARLSEGPREVQGGTPGAKPSPFAKPARPGVSGLGSSLGGKPGATGLRSLSTALK